MDKRISFINSLISLFNLNRFSKMDSLINKFKIKSDRKLRLKDHDTAYSANYKKEDAISLLDGFKAEMDELQEMLYASHKHSLLIIFQAMDAAGKDSAIEHVMSGLNPQGCQVYSFKQPSTEEYEHDFLWRHYKALPERGKIGIHNRSHYENVLICKVHPELIEKEHMPNLPLKDINEKFWDKRYESIRDFEKHLSGNGTVIIKFFLNVSKEEQKERFLDRINDPLKNWKFSSFDIEERQKWTDYMEAYEKAIAETSTENSPWYIIPADKKWFSRIAISNIIVSTLKALDIKLPELKAEEKAKLAECKSRLKEEK